TYKNSGFFAEIRKKPQQYRGIARIFDAVSAEKTHLYVARRAQHYTSSLSDLGSSAAKIPGRAVRRFPAPRRHASPVPGPGNKCNKINYLQKYAARRAGKNKRAAVCRRH
ncbi:MAG: hypothetical protein H7Z39_10710, partial [Burkholderiaceae bacterium]|nr:hypothetical protein [Burkholderiaceae bacterium]